MPNNARVIYITEGDSVWSKVMIALAFSALCPIVSGSQSMACSDGVIRKLRRCRSAHFAVKLRKASRLWEPVASVSIYIQDNEHSPPRIFGGIVRASHDAKLAAVA